MQYGSIIKGLTSDGITQYKKSVVVRGKNIKDFIVTEEQRIVGERGSEVKDMTAHWFTLLKKYENGEINYLGILTDGTDPKTGKITRIKLITEKHETPTE